MRSIRRSTLIKAYVMFFLGLSIMFFTDEPYDWFIAFFFGWFLFAATLVVYGEYR